MKQVSRQVCGNARPTQTEGPRARRAVDHHALTQSALPAKCAVTQSASSQTSAAPKSGLGLSNSCLYESTTWWLGCAPHASRINATSVSIISVKQASRQVCGNTGPKHTDGPCTWTSLVGCVCCNWRGKQVLSIVITNSLMAVIVTVCTSVLLFGRDFLRTIHVCAHWPVAAEFGSACGAQLSLHVFDSSRPVVSTQIVDIRLAVCPLHHCWSSLWSAHFSSCWYIFTSTHKKYWHVRS